MRTYSISNDENFEFIDPNVRIWLRAQFGVFLAIAVIAFFRWPAVEAIDYGAENAQTRKAVVIEHVAAKSPSPSAQLVEKPAPTPDVRSPAVLEDRKSEPVEESQGTKAVANPPRPPLNEQFTTEDPLVELPRTGVTQQPSTPPLTIIAGKTAPHYCLESLDIYKQLARDRGCRFLVTDRNVSIELGRTISPNTQPLRMVSSTWHEQYANRMIPLPRNEEVDRALESVRKSYPQLGPEARVFLSVPHALDRSIYDAQKQFLGDDWNVNCVTLIAPRGIGFQVMRVIE